MTTEYKGVPAGASAVIPRLICRDVDAEIAFCRHTFGAVEGVRRPGPDGRAAHAMMLFGPSMLMIEAEWPTFPSRAPQDDGQWTMPSKNYASTRYSAMSEITPANARNLQVTFSFSASATQATGLINGGGFALLYNALSLQFDRQG